MKGLARLATHAARRFPGVSAVLALCMAGCSTGPMRMYEGAKVPAAEECHVYGHDSRPPSDKPPRVLIRSVDGQSTANHWIDSQGVPEVALKPGRHVVRVQYRLGFSYFDANFALDCERGAEYVAKTKVEGYLGHIWLENAATGAVVAQPGAQQ